MNDIVFNKTSGGLGRKLTGEDHISGIVFYVANATALPAGYGPDTVKEIVSLDDAVTKGITSASADYKILHYHISEFFRINSGAKLYVGIAQEPLTGSIDFEDLATLVNYADGKIRQAAIFVSGEAFATAQVTAIQAVIDTLAEEHKPLSVLFTADFSAVADLTTLSDLRALDAANVSVVIGQDGGAAGAALFGSEDVTISCIGAALGAVSLANVSENIGWPKKFKMVTGTELDVPAFGEGSLLKDTATNTIEGINTKGYIFLTKHIGLSGSFFNDSHTAVAATSDYAYIENNRTIDKAIRNVRTYLLPELNSPLRLDPTSGNLSVDTVKYFESLASKPIEQMEADGDISGFDVYIDPAQDVVSTNKLVVAITLVVKGVARTIEVNIGLATSV